MSEGANGIDGSAIERAIAQHPNQRVIALRNGQQLIWIKRLQSRGVLLRLLKGSATTLLRNESQNLTKFSQQTIAVPTILAQSASWLATSDVGPTLEDIILQPGLGDAEKGAYLKLAILAIAALHQHDFAHGGLHLRNICVHGGAISFIDLEKATPGQASVAAMAYDVVVFFWSAFALCRLSPAQLHGVALAYCATGPQQVWAAAQRWCNRHGWMRLAVKPLAYHERRFKFHKPNQRYQAVVPVLDFIMQSGTQANRGPNNTG